MKNKKNNNLVNFLFYSIFTIGITIFLLLFLTLKNECKNSENEISQLNKIKIHNINIVKELQSKREYFLSEQHITNSLSKKMIAVAPETLIIHINPEQ